MQADHPLRWGILGTGNIARQFAQDVSQAGSGQLWAVGSRTRESAESFARQWNIPKAYGRYEDLLADPQVEAVYISLPNSLHCQWTVAALEAGKHVLCEKPLAVTEAEAEKMFTTAQRQRRVLIEAFMYRTHPLTLAWVEQVRHGAIGRLRLIRASFCFFTHQVENNIRFRTDLAGGALMDVGCYCLDLARWLAGGEPEHVHAVARLHPSGVDELTVGTLVFPDGLLVEFACGLRVHADNTLLVCGDQGYIQVPIPWKPPMRGAEYVIAASQRPKADGPAAPPTRPRQVIQLDAPAPLYALEAQAFTRAVRGKTPPFITPQESLANTRLLQQLRRQIGLNF